MQLRPASTRSNRGPRTEGTRYRGKKGALCEIRALLMVIGPPYDCRVTFDDRTDLIVFYCIRRPTTPTGTFEARVFQFFFPFSSFFSFSSFLLPVFQTESARFETTLETFPGIEGVYFYQGDCDDSFRNLSFPSSLFSFSPNFFFAKSFSPRLRNSIDKLVNPFPCIRLKIRFEESF